MAQEAYLATVQLLVEGGSRSEACDGVSALLSELGQGFVVDWSYLVLGGQILTPTPRLINDDYEEGDAFTR